MKRRGSKRTIGKNDRDPRALPPKVEELLGSEADQLREALERPAPVSIRLNPGKLFVPIGDQVPWCSNGIHLKERPSFTFDPLWHAGAYYVQEASSMFLEQALKAAGILDRDLLALDLCAAPGGKSTHLRSLLTPASLLVANEIDPRRRSTLMENLWKWGMADVIVTGSDPKDLDHLPETFDLIVIDAPCSGEGMFRKDPFAREQWSEQLVEQCAALQKNIVQHAWNALAPGGILIYCTCTWEPAENEEQVLPLIGNGAVPIEIPVNESWNIVRSENEGLSTYRFYPHRLSGEGFCLSMIRKPGDLPDRSVTRSIGPGTIDLPFLRDPVSQHVSVYNDIAHLITAKWRSELQLIESALRTAAPGIPVAERKGDQWKPHPALALSALLDRSEPAMIDLDREQAIAFLKGHALPAQEARGTALAIYRGKTLGWLQGAGNRWNNRWPAAWRIRSHEAGNTNVPW